MAKAGNKRRRRTTTNRGVSGPRRPVHGQATPPPTRSANRAAAWNPLLPALVFVMCFIAYVSNGDFLPGNDQAGNMLFSVNVLKRGALTVSPPHAPDAFFWILEQPGQPPQRVTFDDWDSAVDDAYRQGRLKAPSHYYYLSATNRPDEYANTFGVGAPLAGLPVYAALDLFVDIAADRYWWWHGGALAASLLTAGAALFVFLAARDFVKPLPAFLVALAFGLGSCVWPISSQALWQHPANTFFLSLGAWLLLRRPERISDAAWCGAAFGMAVLCRPASAVVVVCVGAYLLWTSNRRLFAYVLGGLPLLAILVAYNSYYFGSPLTFGQSVASKIIALSSTGSDNLWQSSWLESIPGLLISPQRGLVWFSPVLLLGMVSAVPIWKSPLYRPLIPLQAAVVVLFLVAGRWFDWWGGSTWGYRPIVDATPFLALLMIPVIERVLTNRGLRVLFTALLVWSVTVQFVGAYSYSLIGWTNEWSEYDNPDRASLWQWRRPQIGYHLANFGVERARKKELMAAYVDNPKPILNVLRLESARSLRDRETMKPIPKHSPPASFSGPANGNAQEPKT